MVSLSAAVAGFAATLPMTIAMLALHRGLPWQERYPLPPRLITRKIEHETGLHQRLSRPAKLATTLAAHFGYGALAGTGYAPLPARFRHSAVASGIGYGLAVWSGSYLGLLPALGLMPPATRHPARRNLLMIAAHVVWGAALGLGTRALNRRLSPSAVP